MTKLSELDDSRHAMYLIETRKARGQGLDAPTYRPRSDLPEPEVRTDLRKKSKQSVKSQSRNIK